SAADRTPRPRPAGRAGAAVAVAPRPPPRRLRPARAGRRRPLVGTAPGLVRAPARRRRRVRGRRPAGRRPGRVCARRGARRRRRHLAVRPPDGRGRDALGGAGQPRRRDRDGAHGRRRRRARAARGGFARDRGHGRERPRPRVLRAPRPPGRRAAPLPLRRPHVSGSTRLDVLMAERGIAESRSRAQALIMAGRVIVEGAVVTKAGTPVAPAASIELVAPPRYVSRGGEKLETALRAFGVEVAGARGLDVGSSTGGFTDCLLQHGAAHVVCVDVGRNQLHERLRADARVTVMEGVNARHLEPGMLPYRPELVTADVSFISLRLVLPPVLACADPVWRAL